MSPAAFMAVKISAAVGEPNACIETFAVVVSVEVPDSIYDVNVFAPNWSFSWSTMLLAPFPACTQEPWNVMVRLGPVVPLPKKHGVTPVMEKASAFTLLNVVLQQELLTHNTFEKVAVPLRPSKVMF